MFRIATCQNSVGLVRFEGDTVDVQLQIKDSTVTLDRGKRVIVSDLDQNNNQWAIVKALGTGTPQPPPTAPVLVSDVADIIARLIADGVSWFGAWVKTVRYPLNHYLPLIDGIAGECFASVFERPRDWRLMLPLNAQADLPSTIGGIRASYVNQVFGAPYGFEPPGVVIGPGTDEQRPIGFSYSSFPTSASVFSDGNHVGFWYDANLHSVAPTLHGAVLPTTATVSKSLAAIFIVPPARDGQVPPLPVEKTPQDVFGEGSSDAEKIDTSLASDIFARESTPLGIRHLGAVQDPPSNLQTSYTVASDTLLSLLS